MENTMEAIGHWEIWYVRNRTSGMVVVYDPLPNMNVFENISLRAHNALHWASKQIDVSCERALSAVCCLDPASPLQELIR